VIEVTTIREVLEFEDRDYPDEDEGIEKLVDVTGTFILWCHKDIIVKTLFVADCFTTEHRGTPTSNMPKPSQNEHPSATPPAQNHEDPKL
jgi:hypothetical protein